MVYHPHHQHMGAAVISSLWKSRNESAAARELVRSALRAEKGRRNAARHRAAQRAASVAV